MRRRTFSFVSCCSIASFLCCILGLVGCNSISQTSTPESQGQSQTPTVTGLFVDVAAKSGLKFTHVLGNTGRFYFDEFTAPGCAFIDYDNDGKLDVVLIQSGSSVPASTVHNRPFCALFHNKGDGTFEDVTSGSGLDKDLGYAQGVTVGDYDNDGCDDLFITAYGVNHLFHNVKGSGRFEDTTHAMGLDAPHDTGYATSAAWGDYDNDGKLDLYVCYYALWTHATNKECRDASNVLDYCRPQIYEPETHRLFHNEGKRFVDVSTKAGIDKARGRGLAVAFVDYNHDGKQDIFVADDVSPNLLWRNNGNGTFTNVASQAGCAYDGQGQTMASMGIAIADYNRSGYQSLYISNFSNRPNILFKNNNGYFSDATQDAGLGFLHLNLLSFGCEFFDYDADGWPDLIANNGHVQMEQNRRENGVPLKMRKQLLHNEGNGRFREITDASQLGDLNTPVIGRGLAVGDYDNDGHPDVLAMSQNGPVQLFHNQVHNSNHWVSFKTIGVRSNRDGLHTRFELSAGGVKQLDTVRAGSSYLSSSDHRVYFGLGKADKIDSVTVTWPSGTREVLRNLAADTFYTLTEGKGITRKSAPMPSK